MMSTSIVPCAKEAKEVHQNTLQQKSDYHGLPSWLHKNRYTQVSKVVLLEALSQPRIPSFSARAKYPPTVILSSVQIGKASNLFHNSACGSTEIGTGGGGGGSVSVCNDRVAANESFAALSARNPVAKHRSGA